MIAPSEGRDSSEGKIGHAGLADTGGGDCGFNFLSTAFALMARSISAKYALSSCRTHGVSASKATMK